MFDTLNRLDVKYSAIRGTLLRLLDDPRFVPVCFFCYIAGRIAVLFVSPLGQSHDPLWYYERASGIASGAGYAEGGVPTAFFPVGWPGLLAGVFMITGPSVLAGQIVNLFFSVLVFGLTIMLGTRIFGDRLIGRMAVLLLTPYPNQIAFVPFLATEVFYSALLLLCVWSLAQERLSLALFSGLLFGLATLTKAQSWFLPGFILLGVFLAAPSWPAAVRYAKLGAAIYVAMTLVVAPWTYRNYLVFDAFVPVSTNGGWTLLTGNNPEADGGYSPDIEKRTKAMNKDINFDPADQVAMDRLASERAQDWIKENPVRFLLLLPKKLFRLWVMDSVAEPAYKDGLPRYQDYALLFLAIRLLNQAYYFLLLLLALPPVWLLLRRRAEIPPWGTAGISICLYFTAISLIFSGQSRFHYALMPFIVMYSGWTLVHGTASLRPRAKSHDERPLEWGRKAHIAE
jgi:4-amino-4-deoxy-L-arabinose transferase-like glycosyltransferase